MSEQTSETEEVSNVPNVTKQKTKAPCLETIFKRLRECNGQTHAMFRDLEFVTRTSPPPEGESKSEDSPQVATVNLMDIQQEADVLRNRIRDCMRKLDKVRWG